MDGWMGWMGRMGWDMMNGWMDGIEWDGWMDGWMDGMGWMDGWMEWDGWRDGWNLVCDWLVRLKGDPIRNLVTFTSSNIYIDFH